METTQLLRSYAPGERALIQATLNKARVTHITKEAVSLKAEPALYTQYMKGGELR